MLRCVKSGGGKKFFVTNNYICSKADLHIPQATVKRILYILALAMSILACTDEIDKSNRFTFTGETLMDYLLNRSENFSNFIILTQRAGLFSLLNTYGQYTLFLPDNAAVEKYVYEQDSIYHATKDTEYPVWTGITSPFFEDLSDSMANVIARNHLVDAKCMTAEMGEGALSARNFNRRLLGINYIVRDERFYIMLNNSAAIIGGDNEVENGIVHHVDKVVDPSTKNVPELMQATQFFRIFNSAMNLTGFADLLKKDLDATYDYTQYKVHHYLLPQYFYYAPETRYFKYTGFVEPDDVFREYGIQSIEDLIPFAEKWYGTEEKGNYTNPKNALYKFVAYHFVERELPYNKIVPYDVHSGFDESMPTIYDRYDYFETMLGPMMKVTKPFSTLDGRDTYINYSKRERPFNAELRHHINARVIPLTEFVKMKESYAKFDQMASNGIVHPIDRILLYNEDEMVGNILDERIRIDFLSLIPELSSNNVRYTMGMRCLPKGYSEKVNIRSGEIIMTLGAGSAYNKDELTLQNFFDVEFTLPPLPPRVYEIRLGFMPPDVYNSIYKIGPMQVYIDGKVEGLPFGAPNEYTGREEDSLTYDNGVENDKLMRNVGWMKAPLVFLPAQKLPARYYASYMRKIITRKYLDASRHKIRFRLISDYPASHYLDYLEFVPLHIVNDPVVPEDRY